MSAPTTLVARARTILTSPATRLVRQSMPLAQPRFYSSGDPADGLFTYRIAAASVGKRTPPSPPQAGKNYWNYASTHVKPSPPYLRSTKEQSGEDAFFATIIGGSPYHVALGLADGVGGWQDQGIDPSDFSQGLCGLMAGTAYIHEGPKEDIKPQPLLQKAYDAVIGNPRILAGGSTASLAVMNAHGAMEAANVGDSGFLVFGPGKVTHRSAVQTHAFNTPFQLSKIPRKMQEQNAIFGGSTYFSETPAQADITHHRLKHGDIVLFATDGVWDNLSAQDTLGIVTRIMEEGGYWFRSPDSAGAETMLNETLIRELPRTIESSVQDSYLAGKIASAVMREAKLAGLDRRRNGPFAKEVKKHYPQEGWTGGKPDDIAVVACVVVQEDATSAASEKHIKAKL